MKNKVFKRAISVVVAIAIIAVSLFATVSTIGINVSAATVTDTWDGTKVKPTKTDADGNILIETAEEFAWIALEGSAEETKDKNYKVVGGAVFDLGGMTGITLDSTASDVNDATPTGKNWVTTKRTFAGNLDGNGVTIYNMYSPGSGNGGEKAYSGLFPWICVDNTINTCNFSNITIKASYAKGYHYAAALIGFADSSGANRNINITNVKVEGCYIDADDLNSACGRTAALFVGFAQHCKVTVDSCVAIDNVVSATDIKGGFVGNSSLYANSGVFKNSVVIGSTAYPILQTGSSKTIQSFIKSPSNYSNIYTDQTVASEYKGYNTKVAADDMKGAAAMANMPQLDWSKLIAFDGEYPDLRVNHSLATVSNGASGHSTTCSDCGKALTEAHYMIDNFDTLISSCACGYQKAITQMKDTWDGTLATSFKSGTGTKEDPYIIANAEQMAYVALSAKLDSNGKYFKVVDNAVFNMNGAIGITADSTADQVKAAPKNGAYKWNSESGAAFRGNFDGNGVVIYNIFGSFSAYGGLFPQVNTSNNELSITIKNVAVKASYFAGYHYTGGIVGLAESNDVNQAIKFENCMVENSYMTDEGDTNTACARTTGVIAGYVRHNDATVENCLARGNKLDSINIVGGLIGNTSAYSADAVIKNSISLGTLPYSTQKSGSTATLCDKSTKPSCYSNVYTDQNVSDAYKGKVITLTKDEMTGASSLENLALDYGKFWFANEGTPELQIFHDLKGVVDDSKPYSGHSADCETCGIKGIAVSDHIYDDAYTCTACGFVCDHAFKDYIIVTEDETGDCITAPNTKTECKCGYVDIKYHGEAEGHKLVKTDKKDPTCIDDGNIEYWTCETCEKIFISDDKMAAMNTAIKAEETILLATKEHLPLTDSKGNIVYGMNAQKHWMYCKFCNREIEKTAHDVETGIESAGGHSSRCTVCLYELHDYVDLNEKGKPVYDYDEKAHWYNCNECGKAEYAEHTLEKDESVEGVYQWCEDAEGNSCGYDFFNYALESDDGVVSVVGTKDVYTKDVITDIFKVSEEETVNYEDIKAIFDKEGHAIFDAYDFSPTETMAEGGSVALKMKVKDVFGNNVVIYRVDVQNEALEKLDTKLEEVKEEDADEDESAIVFANTTITESGIYAVAIDQNPETNNQNGNNESVNGDDSPVSPNTSTQNVASAAVVAALSAAAIVFARKIKKS